MSVKIPASDPKQSREMTKHMNEANGLFTERTTKQIKKRIVMHMKYLCHTHHLGRADGGAHRTLDLAGAARVGQQRLAVRVAAHELRLAGCGCKTAMR